jgi:hypothetical protein
VPKLQGDQDDEEGVHWVKADRNMAFLGKISEQRQVMIPQMEKLLKMFWACPGHLLPGQFDTESSNRAH